MLVGGVTNTVKDVARIVTTAGPSKNVISLAEKKGTFLEEQVALFEQENATLLRENRNLALENQELKSRLENTPPQAELSEQATTILKYFFAKAGNGASDGEIACHFKIPMSNVTPYTYLLWKKKFIAGNGLVVTGNGRSISGAALCVITGEGRAYCVENGLAS